VLLALSAPFAFWESPRLVSLSAAYPTFLTCRVALELSMLPLETDLRRQPLRRDDNPKTKGPAQAP